MEYKQWMTYILVCTTVSIGFAADATTSTPSFQNPRKISVTNWIRIITPHPNRSTEDALLLNISNGISYDQEPNVTVNVAASAVPKNSSAIDLPTTTNASSTTEEISNSPMADMSPTTSSSSAATTSSTDQDTSSSTKEDLPSTTQGTSTSTLEDVGSTEQDTSLAPQDTSLEPRERVPATQDESDDKAAADFKRLLNLLQRAGGFLPELQNVLTRGQPLTRVQRQRLAEFARQFGSAIASLPDSLQGVNSTADVLRLLADSGLLEDSGLLGSLTNRNFSAAPVDPQPHTVHWLKCQADLLIMANALGSGQMWALQMLDSWGKPEASILRGNILFVGNSEECTKVHHVNTALFTDVRGKICRMNIYLEALQNPMFGPGPIPLSLDTCLPQSCETLDLNSALQENGLSNISMTCTADLDIGEDTGAIVAIIVLSVFLALMVAGTCTEFCVVPVNRHRPDFINAFVSNNSNTEFLTAGLNDATPNGKLGKHEYINGALELSEVGYISTGNDLKSKSLNGNVNGSIKEAEPDMLTTQSETNLDNGVTLGNSRVLNGDYTDDLPAYNAFAKERKSNGHVLDAYTLGSHMSGPMDRPPAARSERGAHRTGGSPKGDAHMPKWQRALLAFSLPRNTGKILGVKASSGSIACLHGIRVLSLGWVIFGHVLGFSGQAGFFQNRLDMNELMQDFTFQVMLNGTLSVDSFFFMSGLLTAYMFLKECGKQEKVTIKQTIMYYVHRYWRLTPPVLIWVMVVACLVQYVGEGRPAWVDYPAAQLCRDNWWVNLFYIENLYTEKPGCLGVTWYLANDMQFYFLAPLVVIPWIYRKKILGFIMASLLIIMHLVSNAWLVSEYNFDLLRTRGGYMEKLYVKPWARVGPFAIGLIMGYILWKTKCKIHINKYIVAIGWFIAMAAMLTITLVTYDENKNILTDPTGWPMAGRLVHETLSRPVWALVLAWIVLACTTGHGGFINSILSWEGFLPLSRMTYCAFLVHMTVIGYELMVPASTTLYSMTNLIYLSFGVYIMSYAVAFLLAVAVEAPMLGLEKVMLSH